MNTGAISHIGLNELEDRGLRYGGFWIRLIALIIDGLLGYLVIPLFINLYFWIKDGQTIGYKIFGLKIYAIKDGSLRKPHLLILLLYPFIKIINVFTFFIGFIMVGITRRKQGLHNLISNTVVVQVKTLDTIDSPQQKAQPQNLGEL